MHNVSVHLLYNHNTYTTIHGNIVNTIKTNGHSSSEKYTSHTLFEMVAKGLCVRGKLETEQTATYWPPVPLSLAALLSRSAGLLNRGSWEPIALCWVLVLSTASYLQLTDFSQLNLSVAPGYIIVWSPPAFCGRHICTHFHPSTVKVIPDIFDRMHMFLDRRLGWRSICYTPTTTTLPITAGIIRDLNSSGHVIYMPQSSTYQNIAKLLTCPCNSVSLRRCHFSELLHTLFFLLRC